VNAGSELQETTPPFQSAAAGSLPTPLPTTPSSSCLSSNNHQQNLVLAPSATSIHLRSSSKPSRRLIWKATRQSCTSPYPFVHCTCCNGTYNFHRSQICSQQGFQIPQRTPLGQLLRTDCVYRVQKTFASSSSRNFWVCFVLKRFSYEFSNSCPCLKC